jgi:hypothetical protein
MSQAQGNPSESEHGPIVQSPPSGASNGRAALSEEFQRTLGHVGAQVARELREADVLRQDPETVLRDREKAIADALEKAKALYKKKEYGRAFAEWDRVCAYLGETEDFRLKVRVLKESHENLVKVNRELVEVREVLNQRSVPSAGEAKFVKDAHESVSAQVKNVYAHLGAQLRTGRTPRTLSFWWPVLGAVAILAVGFAGIAAFHSYQEQELASRQAAVSSPSAYDDTFLEAQRNAMEKQVNALTQDHEKNMAELQRKHAENSIGDRERIVQLETKVKEGEAEIADLRRQIQALMQDNLTKDRTIASLT